MFYSITFFFHWCLISSCFSLFDIILSIFSSFSFYWFSHFSPRLRYFFYISLSSDIYFSSLLPHHSSSFFDTSLLMMPRGDISSFTPSTIAIICTAAFRRFSLPSFLRWYFDIIICRRFSALHDAWLRFLYSLQAFCVYSVLLSVTWNIVFFFPIDIFNFSTLIRHTFFRIDIIFRWKNILRQIYIRGRCSAAQHVLKPAMQSFTRALLCMPAVSSHPASSDNQSALIRARVKAQPYRANHRWRMKRVR